MRTCSLLVMFCGLGLAQRAPSNLDFEQGAAGEVPPGWFVPKTLREAGYNAAITREGCRTDACVLLTVPETRPPETFGNLMNTIDGSLYSGKRVIFRAAVRLETSDPAAYAAMWVRVDRTAGGIGFFDNMSDRPIRSGQWAFYDIRGTVDSDARWINYGVMVQGDARAWVDDASIQFLEAQPEGPAVSTAREEIGRLYAKIDAGFNMRDSEALKSIATSDARVGSTVMMTPLEQAIRRLRRLQADS